MRLSGETTATTLPDIIMSITVLPLTAVYFVSEVHCTSSVLHSITPYYYAITYKCKGNLHITMITVVSSTIVLLRSTVDYHLIKCSSHHSM